MGAHVCKDCGRAGHHRATCGGFRGTVIGNWTAIRPVAAWEFACDCGHVQLFTKERAKDARRRPKCRKCGRSETGRVRFNGKRAHLSTLAADQGIPYATAYHRIYRAGWTVERALTTPVGPNGRKAAG